MERNEWYIDKCQKIYSPEYVEMHMKNPEVRAEAAIRCVQQEFRRFAHNLLVYDGTLRKRGPDGIPRKYYTYWIN